MRDRQARILLWRTMGRMGEFTVGELATQAGQQYNTALKYVEGLKLWDYVACVDPRLPTEKHKSARYRLIMNTGPHAPIPSTGEVLDPNLDPHHLDGLTKCWLAMRQLRTFDSPVIQTLTELKGDTVSRYLNKFLKADLIAIAKPHQSGSPFGSYRTYALVRDLGPLAPVFRNDGSVFDPNAQRILSPTRRAS